MTYTINSDDACDVFNRAMLKVFQSISTYEGKGDLGAWIRKIVVHEAIDHIRRETRFHATFTSDEVPELGVESDLLDRLSAQDILQVIRKLPGTYRLVLNLYILDGLSHKEISEELNISEGTSKWYLNKARKMLKESLTKLGYETYSL